MNRREIVQAMRDDQLFIKKTTIWELKLYLGLLDEYYTEFNIVADTNKNSKDILFKPYKNSDFKALFRLYQSVTPEDIYKAEGLGPETFNEKTGDIFADWIVK